ncbi:hypothetical protein [Gemmata obscuriglobus]|uniref:hypothetical protein n=1 Tax=Gemmata obscuriglobus TaxID=114 RepID=UPI0011CDFA47|nr:hypothetical protein [Gemmata obscuriglobus]
MAAGAIRAAPKQAHVASPAAAFAEATTKKTVNMAAAAPRAVAGAAPAASQVPTQSSAVTAPAQTARPPYGPNPACPCQADTSFKTAAVTRTAPRTTATHR